jgi:hypothetical protein
MKTGKYNIEDLWMSLRSAFFMSLFIIDPAGFQLVEPTAWREADLKSSIFNRQSSINVSCKMLESLILYKIL